DNVGLKSVELQAGTFFTQKLTNGAVEGLYRVYHFEVPLSAQLAGTDVTLKAIATDVNDKTSERAQTLQVVSDEAPAVTILAPAPNATFREGEEVSLSVSA